MKNQQVNMKTINKQLYRPINKKITRQINIQLMKENQRNKQAIYDYYKTESSKISGSVCIRPLLLNRIVSIAKAMPLE